MKRWRWTRRAIEAQNLAASLALGNGLPQDEARAAKIYRAEMQRGSPDAAFNLATMYYFGEGVKRSWPMTLRLLRRAERMGSTSASMTLAELSLSGAPGMARGEAAAIQHAALALLNGDARGLRMITHILERTKDVRVDVLRPLQRVTREIFGRRRKAR